jgi:hypothetical protein
MSVPSFVWLQCDLVSEESHLVSITLYDKKNDYCLDTQTYRLPTWNHRELRDAVTDYKSLLKKEGVL